jgi:hypothetical protein
LSETTRVTGSPAEDALEALAVTVEFSHCVLHGGPAGGEPVFGVPAVVEPKQPLDLVAAEGASLVAAEGEAFEGGPSEVIVVGGTQEVG